MYLKTYLNYWKSSTNRRWEVSCIYIIDGQIEVQDFKSQLRKLKKKL